MGRKATYTLPEGFAETIVSLMGDEGYSLQEIVKELKITPSSHARFMKENAEYKEAIDLGTAYAEAWWIKKGRENLDNKNFSTGMYAFNMKNRFSWRDTPLVDSNGKGRKLADKFQEQETIEQFKLKSKEKENEKVVN